MTREEAKIFLYSIAGDLGFTDVENYTCKDGEKMREAIQVLEKPETVTEFADRCRECGAKYGKLLKQENEVLDRIRAEIKELDGKYVIGDYATYGEHSPKYVQLMEVLQIIDKYRAGMTEKEAKGGG